MGVRVGMISLGCDKNQVDADVMLGLLQEAGYNIVEELDTANIVIINTCGFIEPAKQESINSILEAALQKENGKCTGIIVSGCLSQRYAKELQRELPEVDAFIGTGEVDNIVATVNRVVAGERFIQNGKPGLSNHMQKRLHRAGQPSAFVKIADGCDNCCTYCVIPYLRGSYQSRKMDDIVNEVRVLAEQGVKEINLVAQDTTYYGMDIYGKCMLTQLLRRLLQVSGPRWFRLLYCYPTNINKELLQLIANEQRVASYLDIPLQHSHSRILEAMNRPGAEITSVEWVKYLRASIPNLTLRTTMIVGFPGETEEEFEHLLKFVEEAQFDHLGAFQYSQEENTVAGNLPHQVDSDTMAHRYRLLMETQQTISYRRNQRYIGRIVPIMLETQVDSQTWIGRGEKDAPDVDGVCYVENVMSGEKGQIANVHITDATEYDLRGENISDDQSGK